MRSSKMRLPDADTIDLWWLPYDVNLQVQSLAERTLSSDEQLRAKQYKVDHARHAFMFYRLVMRTCLASYAGVDPRDVPLAVGEFGKPFWAQEVNGVRLEFNLSHTKIAGLLAISREVVGVDLEFCEPQVDYAVLARDVLSPSEYSEFSKLAGQDQTAYLLEKWTCKEAFLKAKAIGLAVSLSEVTMKEAAGGEWVVATSNPSEDHSAWRIQSWRPQPDCFAAVAYPARDAASPVKLVSHNLNDSFLRKTTL